jgi:hypothetical protein
MIRIGFVATGKLMMENGVAGSGPTDELPAIRLHNFKLEG